LGRQLTLMDTLTNCIGLHLDLKHRI